MSWRNARFQEGEEPAEDDAQALLAEVNAVLDEFEMLIRRINRTSAASDMGVDGTITDALARRDALPRYAMPMRLPIWPGRS